MVYVHFPNNLTEEELMLQKKYQKLKRKRKALQQMKAPKPEPPPPPSTLIRKGNIPKDSTKPDAKEVVKKLLKSGAISAIKVDVNKDRQTFKRSKASERKRGMAERPSGIGYQPYPLNQPENPDGESEAPAPRKPLYNSSVSGGSLDQDDPKLLEQQQEASGPGPSRPKQGNTVYVHGEGITEHLLRSAFSIHGNIANISLEVQKNCGFVTFEKIESAEKAINEMSGRMLGASKIRVSLARRQPPLPSLDNTSESWPSLAANYKQKQPSAESRKLVTYDDEGLF